MPARSPPTTARPRAAAPIRASWRPTIAWCCRKSASCADAKAVGAAPIYQGEPGYSTKLDRDKDGIACDK
ncbi:MULTISPECIES: excalibur calcium-binding domain-containing protein [Rhodococcus]|uniref:excalibur calcium-binding domain-containing protein n=1 Tax=Rhodococcus TaxID=1827 RepID=UPI003140ADD8